jgi:hypothetical protein
MPMTIMKKFCCAILLISMFALAGCPEVAQDSGSQQPSGSRGGGGDS